jgi:hypothetical protein
MQFETVRQWWLPISTSQPTERPKKITVLAIAGMRRLWLERNTRTFDNRFSSMDQIVTAAVAQVQLSDLLVKQVAGCHEV